MTVYLHEVLLVLIGTLRISVQIFAKEVKDIPEWMKARHVWQAAMDVKKLPVSNLFS